ncbi:MAG: Rieske (2Fe-2S) protein [Chloroflexota bacterium]
MGREKTRREICSLEALPPGERKIVEVGRRSIGIFNVGGSLYAIRNRCPHQGAELCRGTVGGTMLPTDTPGAYNYAFDGRILRCPWHFWEFDITTGEMIFVPEPQRVKRYDVFVEASTNIEAATNTEPSSEAPRLEQYDVTVEQELVVLYL